jgi:phosphoribosylformimino-5-aminoimidazole carboxamide ribotide isomerase
MPGGSTIRIIPVLDVMGGVVVQGIGGKREAYRPVVSRLCQCSEPVAVAEAFRSKFGFQSIYLADLDAILGGSPAWDLYRRLRSKDFRLWVDAGVRTADDAAKLDQSGVEAVILGLETIAGPDEFEQIVQRIGPDRSVFSLDLNAGRPLGKWDKSPSEIAGAAVRLGIQRVIVLDLARVGLNQGVGTEGLITELARRFPKVELIAGGGIRGLDDLARLERCGATGALVASALHDGAI